MSIKNLKNSAPLKIDPQHAEILNFKKNVESKLSSMANDNTLSSSNLDFFPNPIFRMLVWNIQKAQRKNFLEDSKKLLHQTDLVLFQEAVSHEETLNEILSYQPHLYWSLVHSFRRRRGDITGVATGSIVKPLLEIGVASTVREPFLQTPKTFLISEFALTQDIEAATLLVVNIHAINFVSHHKFKIHLQQLYDRIKGHQGPLIVAGDFNSWSPARINEVLILMKSLQLNWLEYPYYRILKLDHIFLRGIHLVENHDCSRVKSSDHKPIWVELAFDNL